MAATHTVLRPPASTFFCLELPYFKSSWVVSQELTSTP